MGVAVYILSLPDGAPVTVKALAAHFREGELLLARALRCDGCDRASRSPAPGLRTGCSRELLPAHELAATG
ncbi:hypothetical protein [Saccharothrix sp. ST-888]|uniref:hypothetical protein n=1 Tax=Saccharothrix sp. ST-888 TaxID=1427391 RepID=UPI000697106E|nr:hypothetical protein [Saccharothrix sp. ST-888]